MTTDDLTERIARALARQDGYDPDKHCDEWIMYGMRESAAAVLPIVEAEVRKAKAEAWDEGCEAFEVAHKCDHIEPWGHLRDNPYRTTETGGSDEHR